MLPATERDHRAEHGQPQEKNPRELIRPDQRPIEPVACNDAGEEHDDLDEHEQGCRAFGERADRRLYPGT